MNITFAPFAKPGEGALVVGVMDGSQLTPSAKMADKAMRGALRKAIAANPRFTGKPGQTLEVLAPAGLKASRVVAIGMGKAASFDALYAENMGASAVARLHTSGDKSATIAIDHVNGMKIDAGELAAHIGLGAKLRAYHFHTYRTKLKREERPSLVRAVVQTADQAGARRVYKTLDAIADGVNFTRDLVSEPANVLYPEEFANRCKQLQKLGVKVEILGVKEMTKLGMGALVGVGQGSEHESKLVVMTWNGNGKAQPIAFVGKGVCFDSGGISLKPGEGMWDMKWDMAGAAAVTGAMHALASRKAKANVIGVLGLVENMPDAKAQRPGDIVKSMSGQTIEVLNTDAEGRLVLADAVYYANTKFKPKLIVDLATLTGAIMIALGSEFAGLYATTDELAKHLLNSARAEGEGLWRMPLSEEYDRMIDSPAADMKNISGGREAGSPVGAHFIKRFVVDKTPWAHLDIAGMAWAKKPKGTVPAGATGYGVRTLNRFVADYCEEKEG